MMQGPNDGLLFLIMQLLVLREQMAPFDVTFAIDETAVDFGDFTGIAAQFKCLFV